MCPFMVKGWQRAQALRTRNTWQQNRTERAALRDRCTLVEPMSGPNTARLEDVELAVVSDERAIAMPASYRNTFMGFLVIEVKFEKLHEFKVNVVKKLLEAGACLCREPFRSPCCSCVGFAVCI